MYREMLSHFVKLAEEVSYEELESVATEILTNIYGETEKVAGDNMGKEAFILPLLIGGAVAATAGAAYRGVKGMSENMKRYKSSYVQGLPPTEVADAMDNAGPVVDKYLRAERQRLNADVIGRSARRTRDEAANALGVRSPDSRDMHAGRHGDRQVQVRTGDGPAHNVKLTNEVGKPNGNFKAPVPKTDSFNMSIPKSIPTIGAGLVGAYALSQAMKSKEKESELSGMRQNRGS